MKRQMLKDFREISSNYLIVTTNHATYHIFKNDKNSYNIKIIVEGCIIIRKLFDIAYKYLSKIIVSRIKFYEFDSIPAEQF